VILASETLRFNPPRLTRCILLLDGSTGGILRSFALPTLPASALSAAQAPQPSATLMLDARTNRLYIVDTLRRQLLTLGESTGRLLSRRPLAMEIAGPVLDARTNHIFGLDATPGRRDALVMLDAAHGTLLRRIGRGGAPADATLALDAGTNRLFLIGVPNGAVRMVDAASGALLRVIALGAAPLHIALDTRRYRAYVAAGADLHVLDTHDGSSLRIIPTGHTIASLVVDEQSGHVLVVTGVVSRAASDPWAWLPGWLRDRVPGIPPPSRADPALGTLRYHLLVLDPAL
jgi:hypothetical protein